MSEDDKKKAAMQAAKKKMLAQKKAAAAKANGGDASASSAKAEAPGGGNALAKRGILKVDIDNEKDLYANYMPFVKGCGLFVPMEEHGYKLGDTAFLMLTIAGAEKKYNVSAKVVWVNPKQKLGKRVPGAGFQITGKDTEDLRREIEGILGKRVNSPLPTATM